MSLGSFCQIVDVQFFFFSLFFMVSRQFWRCCEVGHVFFMSHEFGTMAEFGVEVDLWWFWGFENIFSL